MSDGGGTAASARLATSVWVSALVRRADAAGVSAAVLRRGDPVAGAVLLVARGRDGGCAVWTRVTQGADPVWIVAFEADPDEAARIDEHILRQARYDPDLWAIELATHEIQPLIA